MIVSVDVPDFPGSAIVIKDPSAFLNGSSVSKPLQLSAFLLFIVTFATAISVTVPLVSNVTVAFPDVALSFVHVRYEVCPYTSIEPCS